MSNPTERDIPGASLVAAVLADELDGLEIHNPRYSMGSPGANPAEDASYPEFVPGTLQDADKAFRPRASLEIAAILANELDGLEILNPAVSMGSPGANPAEDANYPELVPGTLTRLLDADKARKALASNSSSFMLQDGQVRVTSTRRENPLYSSQTGDRDSGAYSITSISELRERCAGGGGGSEDYLSWGGDEADDADDVTIIDPNRKFNMRPSNALRGAGPMSTHRSSDGDPPAGDADDVTIIYPNQKFNMRPSNGLRGAGPMSTRRSSDGDPLAEGARPTSGFEGFGFATLDVNASSNLGEQESDHDDSFPTAL